MLAEPALQRGIGEAGRSKSVLLLPVAKCTARLETGQAVDVADVIALGNERLLHGEHVRA